VLVIVVYINRMLLVTLKKLRLVVVQCTHVKAHTAKVLVVRVILVTTAEQLVARVVIVLVKVTGMVAIAVVMV
jgi:hypothetical protein